MGGAMARDTEEGATGGHQGRADGHPPAKAPHAGGSSISLAPYQRIRAQPPLWRASQRASSAAMLPAVLGGTGGKRQGGAEEGGAVPMQAGKRACPSGETASAPSWAPSRGASPVHGAWAGEGGSDAFARCVFYEQCRVRGALFAPPVPPSHEYLQRLSEEQLARRLDAREPLQEALGAFVRDVTQRFALLDRLALAVAKEGRPILSRSDEAAFWSIVAGADALEAAAEAIRSAAEAFEEDLSPTTFAGDLSSAIPTLRSRHAALDEANSRLLFSLLLGDDL